MVEVTCEIGVVEKVALQTPPASQGSLRNAGLHRLRVQLRAKSSELLGHLECHEAKCRGRLGGGEPATDSAAHANAAREAIWNDVDHASHLLDRAHRHPIDGLDRSAV